MKDSCHRSKNPCKVCGKKVNKKNGIQCKGKCQNWFHYNCLHYDTKKINDIKSGVLKILCPCPACTKIKNIQATPEGPLNHQVTQCQPDSLTTYTQHVNHSPKDKLPFTSAVMNEEDSKGSVYVAHSSYGDVIENRSEEKSRACRLHTRKNAPANSKFKKAGMACVDCHSNGHYCIKTCCEVLSTSVSSLDTRPKKRGHSQSLLNALENVCHTVGLLSNQMKDLMGKMGNKHSKW